MDKTEARQAQQYAELLVLKAAVVALIIEHPNGSALLSRLRSTIEAQGHSIRRLVSARPVEAGETAQTLLSDYEHAADQLLKQVWAEKPESGPGQ